MVFESGNLLDGISGSSAKEIFTKLLETKNFRLERIVSSGQSTRQGEWLKEKQNEWVILISGAATLSFRQGARRIEMKPQDYVHIPAETEHRVEWTDPQRETVWLALHYSQ